MATLKNAEKILKGGSTPKLQSASKMIGEYITSINSTLEINRDEAFAMEKNLTSALMTLKFLMKCYLARAKVLHFCEFQCKEGTAGSLTYIFNKAKPLFKVKGNCLSVGVKKLILAEVKKGIAAKAKKEKYSADCSLNDKVKQRLVCG